jgi:hypothetical protein
MKKLSLDAFTLKLIAIISMGIHHIFMVLWEVFPPLLHIPMYIMRGITFPIMAFFLTEGFSHTSNIKRYMTRLLIFGLIAQIPYMLAFGLLTLNIIFTIILGLISLVLYDKFYIKAQKHGLFVALFVVLLIVSSFTVEGSFFGPLMIFLYYVIKDEKKRRTFPLICWGIMLILTNLLARLAFVLDEGAATASMQGGIMQLELLMMQFPVISIGTFLIIPLLRAYNGQRGRRAKFLFYIFYPLHLAILAAITFALGLTDLSIIG